jgi:hypothetical protein
MLRTLDYDSLKKLGGGFNLGSLSSSFRAMESFTPLYDIIGNIAEVTGSLILVINQRRSA